MYNLFIGIMWVFIEHILHSKSYTQNKQPVKWLCCYLINRNLCTFEHYIY